MHRVISHPADAVAHPTAEPYGFGGRLTDAFPSQILMDITEVCNLACVHCPHPSFKSSHHYAKRMMDPALNAKMVEEVRTHGKGLTRYIRYASNGEPLVHPKSYDMIEHAVRASGVFVTLTTNGTIMDEKRTRRLLDAGVHLIDISLDAYREDTYSAIRVGGDLEVTRGNVLRLLEWIREQKSDTRVVVSFVEQPANMLEVEDFRRFWVDAGVSQVVIRRLHSCSGANEDLAADRRNGAGPRRPCLYPWERVVVNARGDLAFCPSDWSHGSYLANYADTTIREIWAGDVYKRLRQAHLTNSYESHSFCGQCPDWAETRWPHEGRSYADMVGDFISEG